MFKPYYSFHSHTYRCGHAEGDMEDYIKKAIEHNYMLLGISDHVFLEGISQPGMRGDYSLLDEYIDTFNTCKEKYEGKIRLLLAFECEYIPHYLDYYKSLLTCRKFDYLICGQHQTFDESNNCIGYFSYKQFDSIECYFKYKDDVIKAMKCGLFFYIAHPDLFVHFVTKITPEIEQIFNEIVDASIKYDIPLELNISGYYKVVYYDVKNGTIGYPCKEFWKIAQEKGAKILYGGDYHNYHEDFGNKTNIKMLNDLINEVGITFYDPIKAYEEYKARISRL